MDQTSAASPTSTQTTTTIGDASAALAMADSSLATPATETPAASDAPAATQQAQPTPEQVPVSTEEQKATGEPPKWRWQDILANARETSAKEAEARVRQEFEPKLKVYEGVDEQTLNGYRVWRAAEQGDAQAREHVARVNPQLAQALGWTQAPQADQEPQPDFVLPVKDAQGNIIGERPIYSAEQQAKREAWLERRMEAKFEQRLQPLQQTAQTFQQREAQATFNTTVTGVLAKMKAADPEFEKHQADVAKALQSDERLLALALGSDTRPPDVEMALELAWGRVHRSKVVPAQASQSEATVLAKLQQQAVAGTVSPAAASASVPKQTLGNAEAALAHARAQLGG